MEGATRMEAMAVMKPLMNDDSDLSYDTDSSGDSKLRSIMERKLLNSKELMSTPHRRIPSEHRDGAPIESPQQRSHKGRPSPNPTESPVPFSSYFNSYSQRESSPSLQHVTPSRKVNLSSLWLDVLMSTPSERDHQTQQDWSDVDSVDSVEQLEKVSMQIRAEIRQAEMKELADAAESAAEAGQEKFAGRACTFGEKDIPENVYPLPLKRYRTYSEGVYLLQHRSSIQGIRRKPKIRVLALRHINEVIPQMRDLHMHLRTHLSLNGVDERSLTLSPDDDEANERNDTKTPVQFLKQLTSWVSKSPPKVQPNDESKANAVTPKKGTVGDKLSFESLSLKSGEDGGNDEYEVGGMLSGHIHAPRPVNRSPIQIPKGLDLMDEFGDPIMRIPSKLMLDDVDGRDGDTVETVPTSSTSLQERHDLEDLSPVQLFKQSDDDSLDNLHDHGTCTPGSFLEEALNEKRAWFGAVPPNMFVTPVHLRGMRKTSIFSGESPTDATDVDWAEKVVTLRHCRSASRKLPHDENLNVPLLNDKSVDIHEDGSPITCLSRKEASFPTNEPSTLESSSIHGGGSLSRGEPSDLLEGQESMKPALNPPRSLSAGEDAIVELVVEEPTKIAELREALASSFMFEKEGDGNEDIVTGNEGGCADEFISKSLNVHESTAQSSSPHVECQRDEKKALVDINEAGEHVLDSTDAKPKCLLSAPRTSMHSLTGGESPPLLPLPEREEDTVSELMHLTECIASKGSADRSLDMIDGPPYTVPISILENEQRLSCIESQSVIFPREIGQIEKASECCAIDGMVNIDMHELKSSKDSTVDPRVQLPAAMVSTESPRCQESRPIRNIAEFSSRKRDETAKLDEREPSNQDATATSSGTPTAESAKEVLGPQTRARNVKGHPILPAFVQHEVNGMFKEKETKDIHSKREELVDLSKVELPVEEDDDDVRSENSSQTPHPHPCEPCECLMAAATSIEENVMIHREEQSNDADPFAFPPVVDSSPILKLELDPGPAIEDERSSPRRTKSCPALVAADCERLDYSTVIPHKSSLDRSRSPMSATSDEALACERRKKFGFHALSMDPCQSASPIKETMDDMMKSLSSRKSFDKEKSDRMQRKENHEFLNNYMYCSKPPGQMNGDHATNFCAELGFDHCEIFSSVLDTYRSIVPRKSSELSLDAGDNSLPPTEPDTWFDIASERFDGALEFLVGSAHAQSRHWNSMFQAPSLKAKKDGPLTPTAQRSKSIQGIILVRQSNTADSSDGELTDQHFQFMYGMTREQFAALPVTERSILHDRVLYPQFGPDPAQVSQDPAHVQGVSSPHWSDYQR